MKIPIYQIDAFTSRQFSGNPAAVCPLECWLDDQKLQSIAQENNLSETAFFVRNQDAYDLRWFTPTTEVDLCGHATLASAFVLWHHLHIADPVLRFNTRSGRLSVERRGDLLVMFFPILAPAPCEAPWPLLDGLKSSPQEVWFAGQSSGSGNYMALYDTERTVRDLQPDLQRLGEIPQAGVIVTAAGERADFVSRYFAPSFGVPEDPVTGSIHCTLVPFWAERKGKKELHAIQVSWRGGELFCELREDRVLIAGRAASYLEGIINLQD